MRAGYAALTAGAVIVVIAFATHRYKRNMAAQHATSHYSVADGIMGIPVALVDRGCEQSSDEHALHKYVNLNDHTRCCGKRGIRARKDLFETVSWDARENFAETLLNDHGNPARLLGVPTRITDAL